MKMGRYILTSSILISAILLFFITSCNNGGDGLVDTGKSEVKDADGNVYQTVVIGTQTWMVENLKTTKYNDGSSIPLITDNLVWSKLSTPGYCWYKNDEVAYKNPYGALYNWYAVATGKLCPKGWHAAADSDWAKLGEFLGGDAMAAGKLKEAGTAHWKDPNKGATNETGFSALPIGGRFNSGAFNEDLSSYGYWWISPEKDETNPVYLSMYFNSTALSKSTYINWVVGFSVRCVKD